MNATEEITFMPIGFVKNKVRKHRFGDFANEVSEIILHKKFAKALDGVVNKLRF